MKLDCENCERLLADDMDGLLDRDDRISLENHLAQCPECRQLREKLAKARSAVAILRTQRAEVVMPVNLTVEIKRQIQRPPALFGVPLWRYATGLVMVVLMVAVILVYQQIMPSATLENATGNPVTDMGVASPGFAQDQKGQSTQQTGAQPQETKTDNMSIAVATTGADYRSSEQSLAVSETTQPFILYSGSLTDLEPIRDLMTSPETEATAKSGDDSPIQVTETFFTQTLPDALSDAKVLRVLTNSGHTVKQVVIMAGFTDEQAADVLDRLRLEVAMGHPDIRIETVYPISHVRLEDLLGCPLYEKLLPSQTERQLTYLLIMIGG